MIIDIYFYGLYRSYWSCWSEFRNISTPALSQITDIKYEEENGVSPEEARQLFLSYIEGNEKDTL